MAEVAQGLYRLLITAFFAVGFVALYDAAAHVGQNGARRQLWRLRVNSELPQVIYGLGVLILIRYLPLTLGGPERMMMRNLNLIVMTYTTLLVRSRWGKLLLQVGIVTIVWSTHALSPGVFVFFVLIILLVNWRYFARVTHLETGFQLTYFLALLLMGLTYWAGIVIDRRPELVDWLIPAVGYFVIMSLIMAQQVRWQADLRKRKTLAVKADYDELTGVKNWRAFSGDLEVRYANVPEQPLVVLALDVDGFKQVNDTYGHLVGNQVLAAFAGCLNRTLRTTGADFELYRTGGEEFTVLLGADAQTAQTIAGQSLTAIRELHITVDAGTIRLTTSIGLAASDQRRDSNGNDTQQRADLNLYLAKQRGKNQVVAEE